MIPTTFLTAEYLKEYTPISSSLGNDVALLQPFILVGEQMHIYNVLGISLTDSLLGMIENGTLSGTSETLVNDYIIPACAWYIFFEASLFIAYRAEAKGITKKYSDNSSALEENELKVYRQSIKDKADFYRNHMIEYLNDNYETYTLWRCTQDNPIFDKKDYSGGIYLGF